MIVAQRGEGRIGPLSMDDFGSLAYKLAILVFLGAAVLTMFRERFTQADHGGAALGRRSVSCW